MCRTSKVIARIYEFFLIDKFLRKPVHQNMDEELDRVVAVQEDDTSSDEDTSSENGM